MFKFGSMMTEGGSSAFLESMAAETAMGAPEIAILEAGMFGLILGVRKIKQHHENKKEAKNQAEENARNAAEQARLDAEAAEQARLEEIARQQEIIAEQQRIAYEQAVAASELQRQQDAQAAQLRADNIQNNAIQGMNIAEQQRQQRIQQMRVEQGLDNQEPVGPFDPMNLTPGGPGFDDPVDRPGQNGHGQYHGGGHNPDGNGGGGNGGGNGPDGPPNPNNGGDDEWRMPNPPDGGGGDNPNPNPGGGGNGGGNNNNRNPYYDLISRISQQIAINVKTEEKEKEDRENPVPVDPTKPQPDQPDIHPDNAQMQDDMDEIMDNQHLIQQEIEAAIGAIGEQELTQEEMLVQLEKIQQTIDTAQAQKIQQVQLDPYSVFSSDIIQF